MKKTALFLCLVSLYACSAAVSYVSLSSTTFPPTTKVDVYKNEKPAKEFVEVGMIVVSTEGSEKIIMKKAIEKAMEVGADGIVMIGKEEDSSSWRVDTSYRLPQAKTTLKFLAIKYK